MDKITRCAWCGTDPLYVRYHDEEWGVPEWDDRGLFEKLILDGFQAGLSWITILKKREGFRLAFDCFQPELIVNYDQFRREKLLVDTGIVRNKAKIDATIINARAWLEIQNGPMPFSSFLWQFVEGQPKINWWPDTSVIPTQTPESVQMSKALKRKGFKFCGPIICYAFMQAVGMVNDHVHSCFRHKQLSK